MDRKSIKRIAPVITEIERLGGHVDDVTVNKHTKVFWTLNGRKLINVMAVSASDHRALKNAISDVRKMARSA